jgi:hypothetical protein
MLLFNELTRRLGVLNHVLFCFRISQNDSEIRSESYNVCGCKEDAEINSARRARLLYSSQNCFYSVINTGY